MSKTAVIFGASGLVGSELLTLLLNSHYYTEVKSFGRKTLSIQHNRLRQILCDSESLHAVSSNISGDDIYICLGTTIKKAGSKEKFIAIDKNYVVDIAKIASQNGIKNIAIISALGANADSMIFYNKVKGEMENAIRSIPFVKSIILRPSLLLGDRDEKRVGESAAMWLNEAFKWLLIGPLKKYAGVQASSVAQKMIKTINSDLLGFHIIVNDEILRKDE